MKREGGWGFLLRLLCPSRRFLQLLLTSSNSTREWNLYIQQSLIRQRYIQNKRIEEISVYLLHCWQNRCCFPPTNTTGVLECFSQTLCRRWYSRQPLRSESHPSTEHVTFCGDPFCVRLLFDENSDFEWFSCFCAIDFSTVSEVSPSFKSTEAAPFDSSDSYGSHAISFQSQSMYVCAIPNLTPPRTPCLFLWYLSYATWKSLPPGIWIRELIPS